MTKYEKRIHDLINRSASHLTAEQVYQALKAEYPQVALATVYNNLNKLCDAGLIRRVLVEGSPDRYDRIVKHDHIVCRCCGKLIDVHFEDLTASLKEQLGEDFFFYDLKVFSLCPDCRKELEARQ